MATRSGKAYSECPASAETNTPNPHTELTQEPSHKETSMDLGDDIEAPSGWILTCPTGYGQRDTGKGRPPNGHAIVRSNARYFKDLFSDHCPGLLTTPPDRISRQRTPTLETPERAGCESPAWSDYDRSEGPYGEIPASWTSRLPVHDRHLGQYGLEIIV
ncbi:hypothetical protein JB92DRAFT_2831764 [Gautieria morchelliformis]|nr:hypothetical protein JB92DRAFT_2831764 [Gautieria morchelliformis]